MLPRIFCMAGGGKQLFVLTHSCHTRLVRVDWPLQPLLFVEARVQCVHLQHTGMGRHTRGQRNTQYTHAPTASVASGVRVSTCAAWHICSRVLPCGGGIERHVHQLRKLDGAGKVQRET